MNILTTAINDLIYLSIAAISLLWISSGFQGTPKSGSVEASEQPTCINCDEPVEWSEQFCQEHWEQHCADAFWQEGALIQEALDLIDKAFALPDPAPATASCGWGTQQVEDWEVQLVEQFAV